MEVASGASGPEALAFRTAAKVDPERIKELVRDWSGEDPKQISEGSSVVPTLDHRRYLNQLRGALENQPLRMVQRVGLTLQVLQDDLLALKPALIAIFCHGTKDGELLFEDGRGLASFVSGDRVFEAIDPRPQVLFLAACHSEAVLVRAKQADGWSDCAVVSVDSDSPIEVTAAVEFQARFFRMLLNGKPAGEALAAAKKYVAGSDTVGDVVFGAGEKAASEKFRINDAGGQVKLNADASQEVPASFQVAPRRVESRLHRATDRFVGRREEMAKALNALLPLPAGLSGSADRRIVTLTKEGGIGKTSLAGEISAWAHEREFFPGGVFEVSCEEAEGITGPAALLTRLLEVFGVPAAEQKGNLMALLQAAVGAALPQGRKGLLVLDNLDHLVGQHVEVDAKRKTHKILETLLTSGSELRILATCRWPLDLAHHETIVEVGPLSDEDSRDVFLSHVMDPAVRLQAKKTWELENSPVRQLILLSGRHPQSLELLAGQLRRPGMDLAKLRDEAHANLLGVLSDPYAADNDDDRLLKVERTLELSYRQLGEPAKKLFARLSHLPAGIWCGEMPEQLIEWDKLLGEDWKQLIEKELDYYSLGHFESGPQETRFFRMLPAMVEFSREKFQAPNEAEWTNHWAQFWRDRLQTWNSLVSGRLPEKLGDVSAEQRAAAGKHRRNLGVLVLTGTQGNWLAAFELVREKDIELCRSLLLSAVPFLQLTGQQLLMRQLAKQAVAAGGTEQTLAPALGTLGIAQGVLGEWEAARESLQEALKIYHRLVGQQPAEYETDLAKTLGNLSNVQSSLGERKLARATCKEALNIYRRLAEQNPTAYEPDVVAATLNGLGNAQRHLGEPEAARDSYEEALEIYRRLAQQHPATHEPDVAMTLNNLGNLQSDLGEREAARESYEEALEIYRRLAEQHPAAYTPEMAGALNNLGNVQRDFGERETARESFRQALEIYWLLVQKHPKAHVEYFVGVLKNYTNVAPDSQDDPWWQLQKMFEQGSEGGGEPRAEAGVAGD